MASHGRMVTAANGRSCIKAPLYQSLSYIEEGCCLVAEQLYATLKTNQGDIEIRLLPNHAPKTVRNFVELAEGSVSGPTRRRARSPRTSLRRHGLPPGDQRLHDPGRRPAGQRHRRPRLPVRRRVPPGPRLRQARTCWPWPTPGPGTNGSQFFITVSPDAALTRKHTIFGEVTDGPARRSWTPSRSPDQPAHRPPGRGRRHRVGHHRARPGLISRPAAPGRPRSRADAGIMNRLQSVDQPRGRHGLPPSPSEPETAAVPTCYRHPGRENLRSLPAL